MLLASEGRDRVEFAHAASLRALQDRVKRYSPSILQVEASLSDGSLWHDPPRSRNALARSRFARRVVDQLKIKLSGSPDQPWRGLIINGAATKGSDADEILREWDEQFASLNGALHQQYALEPKHEGRLRAKRGRWHTGTLEAILGHLQSNHKV